MKTLKGMESFAPTVDELMAETVPEVPDNVVNLADARKKRAQA